MCKIQQEDSDQIYEDRLKKAIQFLNKKWKNAQCPYCGCKTFSISTEVFKIERSIKKEKEDEDGTKSYRWRQLVLPIVPISCDNCKNTTFINLSHDLNIDEDKGENI